MNIAWRLLRALNVNVIIRMGIFMWLFAPNLGTYRMAAVCVVGAIYYLHHVGLLHFMFARFFRRGGAGARNNEVRHRNPNGDENAQEAEATPPPALSKVDLMKRFLVGLFASLWPTFDHRNLYPAPVQVRQ